MFSKDLKDVRFLAEISRKIYYTQGVFLTNIFREVACGEMPTILLIRHGESQSNAGRATSCPESIELTDHGQKQAEFVAQEIRKSYPSLDLIVTSSYTRAKDTARWTEWLFKDRGVPIKTWPVHEFTYLSTWGTKDSTVEERRPAVLRYWEQSNPSDPDGPGAESFEHFIDRVRGVKENLDTIKGTVAVFSHNQFICALLWLSEQSSLKINAQTMRDFRNFLDGHFIPNGAIVRVQFGDGGGRWHYEILTSHLKSLEEDETGEDASLRTLSAPLPAPTGLSRAAN
jgi:broad specificity phosphatase PhoE